MATFTDILGSVGGAMNTAGSKIDQVMTNPWMQLGMQLMAQSGPSDLNTGQRLAQAGMGYMQQRAAAAEAQRAQAQQALQTRKLELESGKLEREEATRSRLQQLVQQDPSMLQNNPMARAIMEASGDPSALEGIWRYGQQSPAAPRMPYTFEVRNADGSVTQKVYNPETGGYTEGPQYVPPEQQRIWQAGEQFETTEQRKAREAEEKTRQFGATQSLRERQLDLSGEEVEIKRSEALRKSSAAVRSGAIKAVELSGNYRGAVGRFDDAVGRIDELLKHPGLPGNYGLRGWVKTVPGTDAADARVRIDELKEVLSFAELNALKQMGVNLAPVTEAERDAAGKSVANLDRAQSVGSARKQLREARAVIQRAREEATANYGQIATLYQQPAGQQPGGQPPADFDRDMQDAQRVLQSRPELRDEVNRRLMQKHGRGL